MIENIEFYRNDNEFYCWSESNEDENCIYYKNNNGKEMWWEFNKEDKLIHYRDTNGLKTFYKWIDKKQVKISQEEFEQIKSRTEFLKRKHIPRYKILDI